MMLTTIVERLYLVEKALVNHPFEDYMGRQALIREIAKLNWVIANEF